MADRSCGAVSYTHLDWHLCANMKRRLLHEEKFTYHYHSVSKEGKDSYYEAYVVKGKTEDETFDVFLGYRNIDNILYKEKEIQEKLRKTLDEARLGNEIISSIARTYQYISRIDIQADYFEEISNRDVEHLKYIHSGTPVSYTHLDVYKRQPHVVGDFVESLFQTRSGS